MLILQSASEHLFDYPGYDCQPAPILNVKGQLPSLPHGTWYLNGPGGFERYGLRYRHWLDGDGLIRALTFTDDAVTFASRFVRTRKYCDERRAGRPLYRTFGSAFSGDRLNGRQTGLESAANVSVIKYGRGLIVLGEQGEPWSVDPETLATEGTFTAGGALTPVTPFAAHAKVDPETGEMFNFGVSFAPDRPELTVFGFDAAGAQRFRSRVRLHCSCAVHDFALSPSFAAFYVSPYVLDMSAIRGGRSVMEALAWRPELGSRIVLASRTTGELVCSIPIGDRYCLHTINCYEAEGQLVLDVIEMPAPVYDAYTVPRLFSRPIDATPVRFRIDPVRQRIESRVELPCRCAPEFPALEACASMREYRHFWTLGMSTADKSGPKFFDELVRFSWDDQTDLDSYVAPSGMFLGGEPLVLTDHGRDVSWILCQLLDTQLGRSGFAVFDAFDLRRGPIASLWLGTPTPMAFHGTFVPRAEI